MGQFRKVMVSITGQGSYSGSVQKGVMVSTGQGSYSRSVQKGNGLSNHGSWTDFLPIDRAERCLS